MSSTTIDVYDGRRFLGHVTERDKGRRCEAYTVTGQAIGVFPSPTKAARALHEAAHNQQQGGAMSAASVFFAGTAKRVRRT